MSDRGVARRYAGALFDITHKAGQADRAGEELGAIVQIVEGHAELRRVLETPAVPATAKKEIVKAVLEAAGGFSPEVVRLVVMLAERGRLGILAVLSAAYTERLQEAHKTLPAEVITAAPLSDASRTALTKALGDATGRRVTISERVDPAIVGGIIARVGSLVFDGSVTRQLERMREQLTTSQ